MKISCLVAISAFILAPLNAVHAQMAPSQVKTPVASGSTENIPASYSGPSSAVAAIVNDKVITTYDVEQRMKMMIVSSGGRLTREMLGQLQAQAVRDLIQEKLKKLEMQKFDLTVSDAEIYAELQRIAGQGGGGVAALEASLAQEGINIQTLKEQIEVGVAWPRLVQGRFGSRVRISEEEVDSTYERMREDATNEQYLVSEICIPVPDPQQAKAYYEGSMQLIEQMRRGVPFAVVAQQFSACPTAAAGGDMGWVTAGEMPDELDQAIQALPPGSVTNPIPSGGALIILAVRDKREAAVKGEESYTLAYAGAPLSLGRAAARQALEKLPNAEACAGNGGLRQDLGPQVGISLLENVTMKDIDERFHTAIDGLERHELSPIIEADEALHAAYVCEKDEGLGLPSRDLLSDRIYSRQISRIAQQYIRDVERDSLVEVRLKQRGPSVAAPAGGQ